MFCGFPFAFRQIENSSAGTDPRALQRRNMVFECRKRLNGRSGTPQRGPGRAACGPPGACQAEAWQVFFPEPEKPGPSTRSTAQHVALPADLRGAAAQGREAPENSV
jgi:hypothetical protein